uniref:DUF3421 domain-containing protein n=2 Tax=Caenorhabditis tropicalis TaxID=1561998 RepID=A0A1I7TBP1_9PELO
MLMSTPSALLSGDVLQGPVRLGKTMWKLKKMAKGYPVTRLPHVPKVLRGAGDFEILAGYGNHVAVTRSADKIEASGDCIDKIRLFVMNDFEGWPNLAQIPRDTVAVTIATTGFRVGVNCHDIQLADKHKTAVGQFTWRKLSSAVQVVYFTDKTNNEFLAGLIYYLTPSNEISTCLTEDMELLTIEIDKKEPFPLSDRKKNPHFKSSNQYGRYCSRAQKRVLVWAGKMDGQIVHRVYNPLTGLYTTEGCIECAQDYKNYVWKEPGEKTNDVVVLKRNIDIEPMYLNRYDVKPKTVYHIPSKKVVPKCDNVNLQTAKLCNVTLNIKPIKMEDIKEIKLVEKIAEVKISDAKPTEPQAPKKEAVEPNKEDPKADVSKEEVPKAETPEAPEPKAKIIAPETPESSDDEFDKVDDLADFDATSIH